MLEYASSSWHRDQVSAPEIAKGDRNLRCMSSKHEPIELVVLTPAPGCHLDGDDRNPGRRSTMPRIAISFHSIQQLSGSLC